MSAFPPAFTERDRVRSSPVACWSSTGSSSSKPAGRAKRPRYFLRRLGMRNFFVPVLLVATLASSQTRKLTIDDLLAGGEQAYGRRGNEVVSRDGKFSVFVEHGQVAIKAKDGGEARAVTSWGEPKSELALSADEQNIAYISDGQLWTVLLKGGEPLELTHDPAGRGDPRGATDHHPQWDPNGRWILYESGQSGANELYVISADGKVKNKLA